MLHLFPIFKQLTYGVFRSQRWTVLRSTSYEKKNPKGFCTMTLFSRHFNYFNISDFFVYLSSVYVCLCLSMSVYVCILSVCLSICRSPCLCPSPCPFVCPPVRLSVCLFVRLSVSLSVCLPLCLSGVVYVIYIHITGVHGHSEMSAPDIGSQK